MFDIYSDEPGKPLFIVDRGPWDLYPTITNDAEYVVYRLVHVDGLLGGGRRLFYFDSENQLDEILIEGGKFAGFRPGPRRPA